MKGRLWWASDNAAMRRLCTEGKTCAEAAEYLDRTPEAIRKHARELGIKFPDGRRKVYSKPENMPKAIEKRPCMCCGGKFDSEGIHHRLCARCRRRGDLAEGWEMVV